MVKMGYTETNSWSINEATHGTTMAGTKWTLAVQAFDKVGIGSSPVEKAQYLNTKALGSVWSSPLTKLTVPSE